MHAVCEPTGAQKCAPNSSTHCCDGNGEFLSTVSDCYISGQGLEEKILGYCNAGECASHHCTNDITTDEFCGASETNPCKAACMLLGDCYDTAVFPLADGGEKLKDGAICSKDGQKGAFGLGACGIDVVCH